MAFIKRCYSPTPKKNNRPIATFGLGLTRTQACPRVGSDRVCAKPASDPTRSSGQTFNPSPTERMIGSGRVETPRAAIVFGSESRSRKQRKSSEKTTKIDQNPLRFRKKQPRSRLDLAISHWIQPRSRLDLAISHWIQPRTRLDLAKSHRIQPKNISKLTRFIK